MLKTIACCLLAAGLTLQAQAGVCPDYQTPASPPSLSNPVKKQFRHFGNTLLSGLYKPWHMVHDMIVKSGSGAVMMAKFDYDALLHKDLEDERIHAYLYGTGMNKWEYLGSFLTNSDGKIYVPTGQRKPGEYVVRFVVEGDLSSTQGYLSVVDAGRDAVLFDIDGTLTINDFEAYADYIGVKTATAFNYAVETVNAYKQKGYQIIYLTARPYWVTKDGREWLQIKGINQWHYHSNPYGDGPIPPNTQQFKTDYVRYLKETVGLNIIRAYGNATTDIAAYADGGLPKANTYIIGPNAGKSGTQAIQGDYTQHFVSVVKPTPRANCR
ncbi:HAD family acid phosphatase [Chitinivorax sp. B]|uniref:lipin/Ned1/Smp2 family protein n=1 Tax=Chitinivorax sp. B TaxID=2502235 RepID=UPI0010F5B86D|nr:HAD family acid phosphatase [Chitinivorax sp. B]